MATDQLPKIKILIFLIIVSIALNGSIAFGYSISIAENPVFTEVPIYDNETGKITGYETINSSFDVSSFTLTSTVLGAVPIANIINSAVSFPFPLNLMLSLINVIIVALEAIILFFIIASQIPIAGIGG